MKVETNSPYKQFLINKEIQRAYNFQVTFENLEAPGNSFSFANTGFEYVIQRTIEPYHIKNINLPTFSFRQESQQMGAFTRSAAVLDIKDSLTLKLEMEEDGIHTIGLFVQWLTLNQVDEHGLHKPSGWPVGKGAIIKVEIFDYSGRPVITYKYYDCQFLDATEITYDTASNDAIKCTLTFLADNFSYKPYLQSMTAEETVELLQTMEGPQSELKTEYFQKFKGSSFGKFNDS
jgi:hypothetical protein